MVAAVVRVITNVLRPTDTSSCDMQSGGKTCCADTAAGRKEASKSGLSVCPKSGRIESNPTSGRVIYSLQKSRRSRL